MSVEMSRELAGLLSLSRMDPVLHLMGSERPSEVRREVRHQILATPPGRHIVTQRDDKGFLAHAVALDRIRRKWDASIFIWSHLLKELAAGRAIAPSGTGPREGLRHAALGIAGDGAKSALRAVETAKADSWEQALVADATTPWQDVDDVLADAYGFVRAYRFEKVWSPVEQTFSDTDVDAALRWAIKTAREVDGVDVEIVFPRLEG